MRRQAIAVVSMATIAAAAIPAGAASASQVGANFTPDNANCGDVNTVLQTVSQGNSYAASADGVITSWTFQSDVWNSTIATLRLVVARPAGGIQYMTVDRSPAHMPLANVPNTYTDVRIPVRAGDILGYFSITAEEPTNCGRLAQPGFDTRYLPSETLPGSTHDFTNQIVGEQLSISASLEPDCDSDGFGDETQDQDILSCPPGPGTTITNGPKDKTKKKQATFEFTANEPGATFECSLDGGAFTACNSPDTIKVKKGKHHFEVRARDAGANVGLAASDDWKVKKKKKKK
jgi:hypothetical protein